MLDHLGRREDGNGERQRHPEAAAEVVHHVGVLGLSVVYRRAHSRVVSRRRVMVVMVVVSHRGLPWTRNRVLAHETFALREGAVQDPISSSVNSMRRALLPRRRGGMFPLMVRLTRPLHAFAAIAVVGSDVVAQGGRTPGNPKRYRSSARVTPGFRTADRCGSCARPVRIRALPPARACWRRPPTRPAPARTASTWQVSSGGRSCRRFSTSSCARLVSS